MTDETIRAELARRWRGWVVAGVQGRKHTLLVAGYCRLRFAHRWGEGRRGLLAVAERPTGRTDTPELADRLRAYAGRLHDRAARSLVIERRSIERGDAMPMPVVRQALAAPEDLEQAEFIRLLARSLHQPEEAAGELVGSPLTDPALALAVVECLRPAAWDRASEWAEAGLPDDLRRAALQVYESGDFGPLPDLADRLEAAGCPDRPLLAHCRAGCPHVRGCAAIDRLCGFLT